MNLARMITDQLSGDAVGKLNSLLGANEEATQRATAAAVPSLLSALANLASSNDGAKKLTGVLGNLDANSLGNISDLLGDSAGSALNQGTSLLGSLFSNSLISGLANAVSRFSGLNASTVKSLLAYLSPLVLGKVASYWKTLGGGAQGLQDMFAEQRENISYAMPTGFSLSDIPEASPVAAPVPRAYGSERSDVREPVGAGSSMNWLLPAAMALLAGFLLWQFMRPRGDQTASAPAPAPEKVVAMKPSLPEVSDEAAAATRAVDDLSGVFTSLEKALSGVDDPASAERALPELTKINASVDGLTQALSRLPESTIAMLRTKTEPAAKAAVERAYAVGEIAGIDSRVKDVLQDIILKIVRWFPSEKR